MGTLDKKNKDDNPKKPIGSWAVLDSYGELIVSESHDPHKPQDTASVSKIWTYYTILAMRDKDTISEEFLTRNDKKIRAMIHDSHNVYALDLGALAAAEWQLGKDSEAYQKLDRKLTKELPQHNDYDKNRNRHAREIKEFFKEHNLKDFAYCMNYVARQQGLVASHFVTADGMPHEKHYSTAYDMARMDYLLLTRFAEEAKLTKHSNTAAVIGKGRECVSGKGGTARGVWGDDGFSSISCYTRNGYILGIAGAENHDARDAIVKKIAKLPKGKTDDFWVWLFSEADIPQSTLQRLAGGEAVAPREEFDSGLPSHLAAARPKNRQIAYS